MALFTLAASIYMTQLQIFLNNIYFYYGRYNNYYLLELRNSKCTLGPVIKNC